MLENKKEFKFEEFWKEQIYFKKENGEIIPMVWTSNNKPITIESSYDAAHSRKLKSLNKKKAFTDPEIEQLKTDRKNNMSIRKLAEKYNKSTATIQKYLKLL